LLSTKTWIEDPQTLGGAYSCKLWFEDPTRPQYLAAGDTLMDARGYRYKILETTVLPFVSGNVVQLSFLLFDVLPLADTGYTSTVFTPGQKDYKPALRTPGEIFSSTLFYGPLYSYEVTATWSDPAHEALASEGDRVVDSSGKEFTISMLDPALRFTAPFRMREVEKEGVMPTTGPASLYRPTSNYKFFQGVGLKDEARAKINARDIAIIDGVLQSGTYVAAAGDTVVMDRPLGVDADGKVRHVDVSSEQLSVGVCGIAISSGFANDLITVQTIGEYTISSTQYGSLVYVAKDGTLSTTAPTLGEGGFVEGDFIVVMGMIRRDIYTGESKLILNPRVAGQI